MTSGTRKKERQVLNKITIFRSLITLWTIKLEDRFGCFEIHTSQWTVVNASAITVVGIKIGAVFNFFP